MKPRRRVFALLQSAVFLLPALLASVFAWHMPQPASAASMIGMTAVVTQQVGELEAVFEALDYRWPPVRSAEQSPAAVVPAIAVRTMPADLDRLTVAERKAIFFRVLAPLVAAENRRLRKQRDFLLQTFEAFPRLPENGPVTSRVRAVARRFNMSGNLDDPKNRALLLRRVDIVPVPLALAQAANESGWGRSRFVREANNLFGMWTWNKSQGIRPKQSSADSRHFVRVFDDLTESVNNYLHTINTGSAYHELRELRAQQRTRGEQPDARVLAAGLTRYSARGEEYVREIRDIIEYNDLHELPPLRLEQGTSGGS